MTWWQRLIAVIVGLPILAVIAVIIAYELSHEGQENRAIKRRMQANARRARRGLYEEQHERVRQELRSQQRNDETYRKAFRDEK
jgi:cell division protein ZapA (FtsZ GTPase activity inhibitor)